MCEGVCPEGEGASSLVCAMASQATQPTDRRAESDQESLAAMFEAAQKLWADAATSYQRLEDQVKQLNQDLEHKNRELDSSLREQQRLHHHLRSIVDSLHHGVIAVDPEGRISLFNRGAAELTGRKAEDALGKPYDAVFPNHPPILLDTLRTGRSQVREFEDYLGGGEPQARQMEVTTTVVRNGDGRALGAVEVLHDLTEMRKMEAQLRQARVLADLGEMSVSIAHEIRNPLGAIQLFVETLRDETISPDVREKTFDGIFGGIRLMNHTITNLLEFTRPVTTNSVFRNLSDLLDQSLILSEHVLRTGGVTVRREYPPVGLMCHVDDSQFLKALLNLLLNAVQAMEKRDERKLTVRGFRHEPDVRDPASRDPFGGVPWVQVEIADTGCGIAENMLERIFTPFVTTKHQGVGLGMPIVYKIVQAHGGQLTIDSKQDVGTCVRVLLPVYRPESPEPELRSAG
ncbi:PAS domain-containing protein [Candidatus Poribacteria bacterium]|nr:PAS domain-containing protein [Candidatus Poribacteria bacterium]